MAFVRPWCRSESWQVISFWQCGRVSVGGFVGARDFLLALAHKQTYIRGPMVELENLEGPIFLTSVLNISSPRNCWKCPNIWPIPMTSGRTVEHTLWILLVIKPIAVENHHRKSGFSHWRWWFSTAMFNDQRVIMVPLSPEIHETRDAIHGGTPKSSAVRFTSAVGSQDLSLRHCVRRQQRKGPQGGFDNKPTLHLGWPW